MVVATMVLLGMAMVCSVKERVQMDDGGACNGGKVVQKQRGQIGSVGMQGVDGEKRVCSDKVATTHPVSSCSTCDL